MTNYALIINGCEEGRSENVRHLLDLAERPVLEQYIKDGDVTIKIKRVIKGIVPACGHKVAPRGERKWCGVMSCPNYVEKHNPIAVGV